MSDFWKNIGKTVTSPDFLGSAFSTIASTVGNLLVNESNQSLKQDEIDYKRQQDMLNWQLAALKAQYGEGAGGGGGGGGADRRLTTAQAMQALQNQADLKSSSIRSLRDGYLAALLGR